MNRLGRFRSRLLIVATSLLVGSCGSDPQGPVVELPIDGTWDLFGFYAFDVDGLVQCGMTGTLEIEQLPGGVNTIVGIGRQEFDCTVDGEPEVLDTGSTLRNSRLNGTALSLAFGACNLGAEYEPTRPDLLFNGIGFCEAAFVPTGLIFLAGTWEGRRKVQP